MAGTPRKASAVFIYVTIALDAIGFGIVVPVVPDLVMRVGHIPASDASFWVGALLAAFSAMQFVAAPVLGGVSDRFGRRPVLLFSLAALGLAALLTAFVPSLFWLLALRMAAGATSGNISAAMAYIADVTPPAERAGRYGSVGALFGLGFVLGPALGGALGGIDVRLPFVFSAGLAAANVMYGVLLLPESLPREQRVAFDWRRANPIGALSAVFVDTPRLRLGAAWCCIWFALGAQQSSFILANELRFHWNTVQNGLALALAGVSSALVQGLLVRRAVARWGMERTATVALGLSVLGYVCYAYAVTPAILFGGVLILALGSMSNPAVRSMLSVAVGPHRQGEVQGALASLQGLMAIAAPLTMGGLFARTTRPSAAVHFAGAPFALAAIVCGAGALVVWRLQLPRPAVEPAPLPGAS